MLWKEGNLPLGNIKHGSLGRRNSLVIILKQDSQIYKVYDTPKQGKVQNKIIKLASNNKRILSSPQTLQPKKIELTKVKVIYDALAKFETGFALNDCLEQNHLFKIRHSMYYKFKIPSSILCANTEKTFLEIRTSVSERDCLS